MQKRFKLFVVLSLFLFLAVIGPSFANLLQNLSTASESDQTTSEQTVLNDGDLPFNPDGLIEEVDKRTINSKTYLNPKTKIHSAVFDMKPIHYKDDGGKWQDIVLEFKDSSDPRYSKEYSQGNISIKLSEKSRSRDMVSMTNKGKELVFSPIDDSSVDFTLSGNVNKNLL